MDSNISIKKWFQIFYVIKSNLIAIHIHKIISQFLNYKRIYYNITFITTLLFLLQHEGTLYLLQSTFKNVKTLMLLN